MKKYYLVAKKSALSNNYEVQVVDNPKGMEILKEFDAENYSEAVRRYSFLARNMGKAVYCGVDVNGNPYHGES